MYANNILISHSLCGGQHLQNACSESVELIDLNFNKGIHMNSQIVNRYKNWCAPPKLDDEYFTVNRQGKISRYKLEKWA